MRKKVGGREGREENETREDEGVGRKIRREK